MGSVRHPGGDGARRPQPGPPIAVTVIIDAGARGSLDPLGLSWEPASAVVRVTHDQARRHEVRARAAGRAQLHSALDLAIGAGEEVRVLLRRLEEQAASAQRSRAAEAAELRRAQFAKLARELSRRLTAYADSACGGLAAAWVDQLETLPSEPLSSDTTRPILAGLRRSIGRVEGELARLRRTAQALAAQPPGPADGLQFPEIAARARALDARSALACARVVSGEARSRSAGLSICAASLEALLRPALDPIS